MGAQRRGGDDGCSFQLHPAGEKERRIARALRHAIPELHDPQRRSGHFHRLGKTTLMLAQMSPRERTLALLVGGVLVLLVNLVLIRFFLQKRAEFLTGVASTQGKIAALQQRESQRALWAERD